MKQASALFALGLIMLNAAPLFAESKIGYVDIDRVTSKARQVKGVMDSAQSKITGMQKEIDSKQTKIRDMQADLQRTDGVVSKDEQDKKSKELQRLKNELDELDLGYRREMQKYDDTEFTPLLKKITYAIQDVSKERHFDMIVRGEAVLYGTPAVDITDDVIKKLNSSDDSGTTATHRAEAAAPASAEATTDNADAAKATPAEAAPVETKPKSTKSASTTSAKPTGTPRSDVQRPVDRQKD